MKGYKDYEFKNYANKNISKFFTWKQTASEQSHEITQFSPISTSKCVVISLCAMLQPVVSSLNSHHNYSHAISSHGSSLELSDKKKNCV